MFLRSLVIGSASGFVAILPFLLLYRMMAKRENKCIQLCHEIGIYVFVLYLAGVFSLTGIPSLAYITFDSNTNFCPFIVISTNYLQYLQNLFLFVPLGFILPVLWARYKNIKNILLSGLLLSVGIEISQLFCFRTTDIDDLIMNTLGTLVGYVLFRVAEKTFPKIIKKFSFERTQTEIIEVAEDLRESKGNPALLRQESRICFLVSWVGVVLIQSYISGFLWNLVL